MSWSLEDAVILQQRGKKRIDYPDDILIELTTACNLECIYCANSKFIKEPSYLGEEFVEITLEEAFKLGVTKVGFYGRGESMLSPVLINSIKEAKRMGYTYVYLVTNGCVSLTKLEEAVAAGVDNFKFSISAGTVKTYKRIHGVDCFDKVMKNIKSLKRIKELHKTSLEINIAYIVTNLNYQEMYLFKMQVEEYVDKIYWYGVCNQAGIMDNRKISTGLKGEREIPCRYLYDRFHITAEGYLSACCVDFTNSLIVADLNKETLKGAWNNERFAEIRGGHLRRKECIKCLEWM